MPHSPFHPLHCHCLCPSLCPCPCSYPCPCLSPLLCPRPLPLVPCLGYTCVQQPWSSPAVSVSPCTAPLLSTAHQLLSTTLPAAALHRCPAPDLATLKVVLVLSVQPALPALTLLSTDCDEDVSVGACAPAPQWCRGAVGGIRDMSRAKRGARTIRNHGSRREEQGEDDASRQTWPGSWATQCALTANLHPSKRGRLAGTWPRQHASWLHTMRPGSPP